MPLQTQSFQTIVDDMVAAIQANSNQLVDFSTGSILRALCESNAANSLWIQGLISALLAVTRLSTSHGNDVDTFIADFGYSRPPAVAATGQVTFSRTVTTSASNIPADGSTLVGTTPTSIGQQIIFSVYADPTNPNYNSASNSYVMAIGISSINVPVQAVVAGSSGNVLAGQINTILSNLINVNSVTNSSDFTNGSNAASDDQTRTDFVLYLQGLFRATLQAIEFAVANVPGVERYVVVENIDYSTNTTRLGYFYVIADDGTGSPPGNLIISVQNAVEAYRGLTIQYEVHAPVPFALTIVLDAFITSGISQSQATAYIQQAITTFVMNLPIAGTIYYSKLYEVIWDSQAGPYLINVNSLTINGMSTDVTAPYKDAFTINSITVNYP